MSRSLYTYWVVCSEAHQHGAVIYVWVPVPRQIMVHGTQAVDNFYSVLIWVLLNKVSSVAFGGFGTHWHWRWTFCFQNVTDLKNLPRERALRTLEILLFVQRPKLLFEASQIPCLQQWIEKHTQERELFSKKHRLHRAVPWWDELLQKEPSIMKKSW